MWTWWAIGKAGWRRRFLKQSYFSKPSLEIHKFITSCEKAGKCYKWPSVPVPSLREVSVLHPEEHDQGHSSRDPGSVWNTAQLWVTWWGLVTKLRFTVTRLDNVCQAPVLTASLKRTAERPHSWAVSLHHFDMTRATILQQERNCTQVNCVKIKLMTQITTFKGIHIYSEKRRAGRLKGPVLALPNELPGPGHRTGGGGNQTHAVCTCEWWLSSLEGLVGPPQEPLALPGRLLQFYFISFPALQLQFLECSAN